MAHKELAHKLVGWNHIEVEVEVKLRPTVSRPVRLGVRHPSETRNQIFLSL
jgi:hypothetical protein